MYTIVAAVQLEIVNPNPDPKGNGETRGFRTPIDSPPPSLASYKSQRLKQPWIPLDRQPSNARIHH